jgi:hypothetical protein
VCSLRYTVKEFDSRVIVIDGWVGCTEETITEYMCLKINKKTDQVDMHVGDQLLKSLVSTSADQAAYFLFVRYN